MIEVYYRCTVEALLIVKTLMEFTIQHSPRKREHNRLFINSIAEVEFGTHSHGMSTGSSYPKSLSHWRIL